LQFEIVGNPKTYKLNCKSTCAFPVINIDPRNLFMHRRRGRPANIPERFVNRHFIQTEHVFEFGPLLMGKNYENRHDENCRNFNMTNFRITNNGLYDL